MPHTPHTTALSIPPLPPAVLATTTTHHTLHVMIPHHAARYGCTRLTCSRCLLEDDFTAYTRYIFYLSVLYIHHTFTLLPRTMCSARRCSTIHTPLPTTSHTTAPSHVGISCTYTAPVTISLLHWGFLHPLPAPFSTWHTSLLPLPLHEHTPLPVVHTSCLPVGHTDMLGSHFHTESSAMPVFTERGATHTPHTRHTHTHTAPGPGDSFTRCTPADGYHPLHRAHACHACLTAMQVSALHHLHWDRVAPPDGTSPHLDATPPTCLLHT